MRISRKPIACLIVAIVAAVATAYPVRAQLGQSGLNWQQRFLGIIPLVKPDPKDPVVVTVNGYTWRSTIAPYGADFFVPVRAEIRVATDAVLGERVDVALQRDTAERRVDVPKDLALALGQAGARAGFDALSFTCQK